MAHDPKQLFTISTVSRKDIADLLNENIDKKTDMFTENDPRLTDKVCREIAGLIYDAECQVDELDEAAQVAAQTFLSKGTVPNKRPERGRRSATA